MRWETNSPVEAHSIPEFFSSGWTENRRSRPAIFSVSLAGHVCLIAFLVFVDLSALRPLPVTPESEMLSTQNQRKIVWYNLAHDLPPVTPPAPIAGEPGERAEKRSARQTIVANDLGVASATQKIWDPASERVLTEDVPAPNIVASSPAPERFELKPREASTPAAEPLPAVAAPVSQQSPAPKLQMEALVRMERLRFQQQQRERATPSDQAIDAPAAPKFDPTLASAANLDQLADFERLRFQSQQSSLSRPEANPVDAPAAPEVSPQLQAGMSLEQLTTFERLRFRMTVPTGSAPGRHALDGGTAPLTVPGSVPQGNLAAVYRPDALRYTGPQRSLSAPSSEALARIANAPPAGAIGGNGDVSGVASGSAGLTDAVIGGTSSVPAPPASTAARGSGKGAGTGGPGESDLAVVGLNPSANPNLNVPRGRRPGRFSASPGGGDGNGRLGVPGVENGARVPNLSVSPARPGAALASVPTVVPGKDPKTWRDTETPDGTLMALNRLTGPGSVEQLSAADLERAAKTPPEPKERAPLEDRTVYTMAINMPNISSYQGSWIVRYAQLEEEKEDAPFRAPSPLRKVDPKYVAQAALEGIEGEVLLYAVIRPDGAVERAKVMRGIDERLDRSALEAIEKWQFKPAMRGGEPIAVEALFSIPFQLTGLKP